MRLAAWVPFAFKTSQRVLTSYTTPVSLAQLLFFFFLVGKKIISFCSKNYVQELFLQVEWKEGRWENTFLSAVLVTRALSSLTPQPFPAILCGFAFSESQTRFFRKRRKNKGIAAFSCNIFSSHSPRSFPLKNVYFQKFHSCTDSSQALRSLHSTLFFCSQKN